MNLINNYDSADPLSILDYSKELLGKNFEEILLDFFGEENEAFQEVREQFNNPHRKGSLGNLVEEYFFGYKPNSSPEPDFPEAGVELKVTPYEKTTTAFSAPFYFEYTDLGINKARALDELFPEWGITAENVIAFGDSENDQSIIEYAGMGVAMGNAVPEILEIADAKTATNNEDGIADFLDRYF